MEEWQLKQRLALPRKVKESYTMVKVLQFYNTMDGNVCVNFSAGLDSSVLLHLARRIIPWIQGVFVNTGMEFSAIIKLVKETPNIVRLKSNSNYKEVCREYGFPVVSKSQARYISDVKNPTKDNENTRRLRLTGIASDGRILKDYAISKKWRYLIDAPFKISDKCCDILKKEPLHEYQKATGNAPIIGTRTAESSGRKRAYKKKGCNIIDSSDPKSKPLSIWTDQDILEYILEYNVPYAKEVYGDIVEIDGKLTTTGEKRTGCQLCMFGMSNDPDRFKRLKKINFNMWKYGMFDVGLAEVCEYLNIDYGGQIDLLEYIKKESPCKG